MSSACWSAFFGGGTSGRLEGLPGHANPRGPEEGLRAAPGPLSATFEPLHGQEGGREAREGLSAPRKVMSGFVLKAVGRDHWISQTLPLPADITFLGADGRCSSPCTAAAAHRRRSTTASGKSCSAITGT